MNIKKTKKSQKTRKANHNGCIRKHGSRYEASVYINGKRHYFSAESVAQAKDKCSASRMRNNFRIVLFMGILQ